MLVKPSTFSKKEAAYGLPPGTHLLSAYGTTLKVSNPEKQWATHTVTDWVSGLGTNLLGYEVFEPQPSYSPSLVLAVEYELARRLGEWVSELMGWDKAGVLFCSTGSEATQAAVRIARAVTMRDSVTYFRGQYHGWLDHNIQRTPPARGVIPDYNFFEQRWMKDIEFVGMPKQAALIFEHPVGKPDEKWVTLVNSVRQSGTILIADEVVTGFRYGKGLISELYGYDPDLICFGKALSNGARLGAVVGRWDIMANAFQTNSPVFVSSTTHGEYSALRYGLETLRQVKSLDLKYLVEVGKMARDGLKSVGVDTWGDDQRWHLRFDDDPNINIVKLGQFIRGMYAKGHLVGRVHFPCFTHTNGNVSRLILAAEYVAKYLSAFAGPAPEVLFKGR